MGSTCVAGMSCVMACTSETVIPSGPDEVAELSACVLQIC
jgi:hypothetical protein